jgi:two-component system, NtrC family, response regulator AtoC
VTSEAPRSSSEARGPFVLLVFSEGAHDFVTHPLPASGVVTIGRDPDADVRLDDPLVSRQHARLHVGAALAIEDLGSNNGTRLLDLGRAGTSPTTGSETERAGLTERRLSPGERLPLTPGLSIQIGSSMLVVQRAAAVTRLRRCWSHGYFEEQLQRACDRTEPGAGFAVARVRVDRAGDAGKLEALLGDLAGDAGLLAAYAPLDYELLLPASADPARDIAAALESLPSRFATGRFPADGRSAHALMACLSARLEGAAPPAATSLVVLDPVMQELTAQARSIARGTLPVLLMGETGVGKEIFAEVIHRASPRSREPFVRLNCGALSESLLEAELFGYERGAFTGATTSKVGLLETAQHGTVFLDEIGELPMPLQVKLLRVLEERALLRVGGTQLRAIDVRFVSATNRDLAERVRAGRFREDLYYRVGGACLVIPPLRERPAEIEPLARAMIASMAPRLGLAGPVEIDAEALAWMHAHRWPGNVRELRNVIERALLLSGAGPIGIKHLPTAHAGLGDAPATSREPVPAPIATSAPAAAALRSAVADTEREQILRALEACGGNQTRAAKMLGIARGTLLARMRAFELPRPRRP